MSTKGDLRSYASVRIRRYFPPPIGNAAYLRPTPEYLVDRRGVQTLRVADQAKWYGESRYFTPLEASGWPELALSQSVRDASPPGLAAISATMSVPRS